MEVRLKLIIIEFKLGSDFFNNITFIRNKLIRS